MRELLARRDPRVDDVDALVRRCLFLAGGGTDAEREDGAAFEAPVSMRPLSDIGQPSRACPPKERAAFDAEQAFGLCGLDEQWGRRKR